MKTFVDNVCRQVIERHMLQNLSDVFSPETVAAYNDKEIRRIGEETPENTVKRRQLRELQGNLVESLRGLKR
jgi:hypothetical protein